MSPSRTGPDASTSVEMWTEAVPTGVAQSITDQSRSEATGPSGAVPHARVRYAVTEARHLTLGSLGVARPVTGGSTSEPYEVFPKKDERTAALAMKCSTMIEQMLETEEVIERENIYRTVEVLLADLFKLRSSSERAFGQLVALLLGVTKHTTSELFTKERLLALGRAVTLLGKSNVIDADVREARRVLARAGFDPLRPFRGVFEDV